MPQKELIVNADDFGLFPALDRGIAAAFSGGIVTSASLLSGGGNFDGAVREAGRLGMPVGVHLALTGVRPVLPPGEIPSLTGRDGYFLPSFRELFARYLRGGIDPEEVRREWRAQIEKVLSAGISPGHLDGEQYVHMLPGLFGICSGLALDCGIGRIRAPRRIPFLSPASGSGRYAARFLLKGFSLCPAFRNSGAAPRAENLLGMEASGHLNGSSLRNILSSLPEGISELVCHPGDAADGDPGLPRWGYDWSGELRALTSPEAAGLIGDMGIMLRK